jgi:hypothetical protein
VLARLETGVILRARASGEVFLTAARQCGPASAVVGSIGSTPECGTRAPAVVTVRAYAPAAAREAVAWFAVRFVPLPGHALKTAGRGTRLYPIGLAGLRGRSSARTIVTAAWAVG